MIPNSQPKVSDDKKDEKKHLGHRVDTLHDPNHPVSWELKYSGLVRPGRYQQ